MKVITILFAIFIASINSFCYSAQYFEKGAQKVQLENGLTVIIKEEHANPVVSVQVWVKVGSVHENEKTAGLSHFLEHLIFKGSKDYPGQEISRKVETQGGVINAATSKEFTEFYIDIQKSAYEDAIKILADAMANAVFPPEEIENERPVVIEEIRRHSDNPGAVLHDLFSEAVFLQTPYRYSIIGSSDVIQNITRDEIMNYYHAFYTPENMVLSIAGDLNPDEALDIVKNTFGKQNKMPTVNEPSLTEAQHQPKIIKSNKNLEQAYWMAGFIGPDIVSDEQFAADITSTILGGGRSSRLYRKLREELQLVYSIGASFWSQRGSGLMVFTAMFDPNKEQKVVETIGKELDRLITEGPSEAELKRVKEMTKSQWYFGKETSHEQATLFGYWQMQGNPGMAEKYIDGIEKVGKEDIINFLKKYFQPQGLSQAIIVPEIGNVNK